MNWLSLLLLPVAALYILIVTALFVYGVNFFYLAASAYRLRKSHLPDAAPCVHDYPFVTVQLPIYNECFVAERLIEAAAQLRYPAERLEIQVLDDSTDETVAIAAKAVGRLREKGLNVTHTHRDNRDGFKAGALRDALAGARGEFIAIFDADFVPPVDFLIQTLPYFSSPQIAFVQTRWGHLNRSYSLFTLLQSLSIDAHFVVEQQARSALGYAFNFNGTAGIWRAAAIQDAGGWKAETLTEDLDLSYRVFLRGWQARYANELEVPAELPVSFAAYRRQQHRWAQGSLQCAARFLPVVWKSNGSTLWKLQASLHLTGYAVQLLMLVLSLLLPAVILLAAHHQALMDLFGIAVFLNFTGLAPTVVFATAQHNLGRSWISSFPAILCTSVLGSGMMINTLHAAMQVLIHRQGTFERTPKYGITERNQKWDPNRYRPKVDRLAWLELAAAAFNLWTVYLAFAFRDWMILIYAGLFAAGLLYAVALSLIQSLSGEQPKSSAVTKGEQEFSA